MAPRKPIRAINEPKKESKTIPLEVESVKKTPHRKAPAKKDGPGLWTQFIQFITNDTFHFVVGFILLLVTIYFTAGMISYFFTGAEDQSKMELTFSELHAERGAIHNITSFVGALSSHQLIHCGFGVGAFALLFFSFILALRLMKQRFFSLWKTALHCFFWMIWLSLLLGMVDTYLKPGIFFLLGGAHGVAVGTTIVSYIGELGFILSLTGTIIVYSICLLYTSEAETVPS